MNFVPNTDIDRQKMLEFLGMNSLADLFAHIPDSIKLKKELNLPEGMSELELVRHVRQLNDKNANLEEYNSFLGAGSYQHYIPSIVNHLLLRSEFYTAYTPYQAEISQGTLQAIYEFQSLICQLTGMDVANASMYDASTAMAEAAALASGQTRKNKIVVSSTVHPEYRRVLKTYAEAQGLEVVETGYRDGVTDLEDLEAKLSDNTSAIIVQQPNFFGCIEPMKDISAAVKKTRAMFITSVDPVSLGVLRPPAEYGADIVVGDAQAFGNPISFGGPHVGFFAVTKKLMRKMPGRIAGKTKDKDGRRGFVLTLQAREQHIRREKATSNICSNQALAALAATITMVTLGRQGLKEMAVQCVNKAHYACQQLTTVEGVKRTFSAPFFKEFVVTADRDINTINDGLLKQKIIGGLPVERFYPELKNSSLLCVTEVKSKEQIDELVNAWEGLK